MTNRPEPNSPAHVPADSAAAPTDPTPGQGWHRNMVPFIPILLAFTAAFAVSGVARHYPDAFRQEGHQHHGVGPASTQPDHPLALDPPAEPHH